MSESTETITIEGREVAVFLPASYRQNLSRRFPILLMLTCGLKAHESIAALHEEGELPDMIVAEVLASEAHAGPVDSIEIMEGLAGRYRLLDSSSARWIGGTGHAAVAAFSALLDHPGTFGAACALSTSFEGTEGAPPAHSPMLLHLEEMKSLPTDIRIYFDYGTVGLDECYELYHRDLGAILRSRGWVDGREFQISRHPEGSQEITSWQQRIGPALRWLALR